MNLIIIKEVLMGLGGIANCAEDFTQRCIERKIKKKKLLDI